jgi:hypothetical protein
MEYDPLSAVKVESIVWLKAVSCTTTLAFLTGVLSAADLIVPLIVNDVIGGPYMTIP